MAFKFLCRKHAFLILVVYLLFVGIPAQEIFAQKTFTAQDILQSAIRNTEAANAKNTVDTEINLADKQWIDQMEFRTELNELDLRQQEYTFRMRFKNDKVRQLQNQLYEMQLSLLESENKADADDGAQEIYEAIINLYFNQELARISEQKANLIKDKNKLETTLFKNDQKLNFNDILKINERAKDIQMAIFDINIERQKTLESLAIVDDQAILDLSNLIDIATLSTTVDRLQIKTEDHPALSLHQDRLALLEQEYRIEENDKDNLLKFAQIKYKDDDKLRFERELSFGIGLIIPYKTTNQSNITKIELERIEENFKQQERILGMQNELGQERQSLRNLIKRYEFLEAFIQEENLELLKTEYLASQQVTPLPLINLELMIMDRQIDLMLVKQDIYLQYIDVLESIGALRFSNNTNYLDRKLAPIE